ncbi:MAG TPA: DUF1634 domain-containing protein [Thermoleophilia bacterium]|nr:DUF1634 domain-containing protein [Thermoleophilia bacterium]
MDDRDHARQDGVPGEGQAGRQGDGERRRANVDVVIHHTLAAGVAVGFVLLVAGLALTVAGRGGLATFSLKAPAAWRAALHLRAAGFYSLGLLVLILTPFVRVMGSIVAFAAARDWRFVAVTCAVLAVMIASIAIGAA